MKIVGKIPSSHKWIIMWKLMMLDNYKVNTIFQTFITPWKVSKKCVKPKKQNKDRRYPMHLSPLLKDDQLIVEH